MTEWWSMRPIGRKGLSPDDLHQVPMVFGFGVLAAFVEIGKGGQGVHQVRQLEDEALIDRIGHGAAEGIERTLKIRCLHGEGVADGIGEVAVRDERRIGDAVGGSLIPGKHLVLHFPDQGLSRGFSGFGCSLFARCAYSSGKYTGRSPVPARSG